MSQGGGAGMRGIVGQDVRPAVSGARERAARGVASYFCLVALCCWVDLAITPAFTGFCPALAVRGGPCSHVSARLAHVLRRTCMRATHRQGSARTNRSLSTAGHVVLEGLPLQ